MVLILGPHLDSQAEILFNKIKPIIWLKTNSIVATGVTEYDINLATTSPCNLFRLNIMNHFTPGQQLSADDDANLRAYEASCEALYISQWLEEKKQLLAVNLPKYSHDILSKPVEPYRESNGRKKRDLESLTILTRDSLFNYTMARQPLQILTNMKVHLKNVLDWLNGADRQIRRRRFANPTQSNLTKVMQLIEITKGRLGWQKLQIKHQDKLFNCWNTESDEEARLRIHLSRLRELYKTLISLTPTDMAVIRLNFEGQLTDELSHRLKSKEPFEKEVKETEPYFTPWEWLGMTLSPPVYFIACRRRWTRKYKNDIDLYYNKIYEYISRDIVDELNQGIVRDKRIKRGLMFNGVKEVAGQLLGVIVGNVASNLVSYAVEYIYPNSNTNRLTRLETALADMKKNAEISKQIDRGILENIDKLSNFVQVTMKRVQSQIDKFPQYSWIASLVVNKISFAGADLQRIVDEARRGRLAIEPFVRLTNLRELSEIETEHTRFLSVAQINENTLNFKFVAVRKSSDTNAYRVHAFSHWDNLDETPRLMKYTGAEYMIYNESANCIKALTERPEGYIAEECSNLDEEDPSLNQWEAILHTEQLEHYANKSQVKKTLTQNFIYCFPGKVEIRGQPYRCPMEVFSLKSNVDFKTAMQRHSASRVNLDAKSELAVEVVHAGHFRGDSDVVQNLALFDALRAERRKLYNLTEEYKSGRLVQTGSPWFYLFLVTYLSSMSFSVAYVVVVCYCRGSSCLKKQTRIETDSVQMIPRMTQKNPPPYAPVHAGIAPMARI